MLKGFWQKRISRRGLLTGAASSAIIGGGALLIPRRSPAISAAPGGAPVIAQDIVHTAGELARGEMRGLQATAVDGVGALSVQSYNEALYTSPVVRTEFPANHIGLHWKASGAQPEAIRFELRTSADGYTWSPWRQTYIEATPDENPRGETFASLVTVDNVRYVQYRAALPGRITASAASLQQVTITALTASSAPAQFQAARTRRTPTPRATRTPGPSGNAGLLPPPFPSDQLLTREEWGAPEEYRFDRWGNEAWPRMYIPTKKLVVHHTATQGNDVWESPEYPYPNYSADAAVQSVRAIYYYHAITLGWGDIGYNALVDRFGRVFEGRRGRDYGADGKREIISPDVVGGHALNVNEGSAGVSMIGNYDINQIGSAEANLVKTVVDFLTWSCRRFYISPTGSSDFLLVNLGTLTNMPNIAGHREVNNTACPGQYAYALLPSWRQKVASQVSSQATVKPSAHITTVPNAADLANGSVTFAWNSPDGSNKLFSYYLEGWLGDLNTDGVWYFSGFTADKRPDWSGFSTTTSKTFGVPNPGRYTFHVRAKDSATSNEGAFEENYTFIAYSAGKATHTFGVPGIARN